MIVRGLHKPSTAVEVTGRRMTVLIPMIHLCPSDPTIPSNCVGDFPVKIAFAVTISKAQRQMVRHFGIYRPSPVFYFSMACSMWHFPKSLLVMTLLL
jgi:hypothetical protein